MVVYAPPRNKTNKIKSETRLVKRNTEIDNVANKVSPSTDMWLTAHKLGIDLVPLKAPKSPLKIKDEYKNYQEIENKQIPKNRSSKNLLKNSRLSSKSPSIPLNNKQQLLLENGKLKNSLTNKGEKKLTKKSLDAAASNAYAAIGAMMGFKQVKPKSPESIVFNPQNKRQVRHQMLYTNANKRLKEAKEVSSKLR